MVIDSFGKTDVGSVRSNNEDAFLISDRLKLYCIADGIGSLSFGELASKLAVHSLKMAVEGAQTIQMPLNMSQIMKSLNRTIIDTSEVISPLDGIGTTLTAFQLVDHNANFVHTGDTSAYYFTKDEAKKITVDQTVEQMKRNDAKEGIELHITEEDHHTLTACLGMDMMFGPEYYSHLIEENSAIFLCTDGATNYISIEEMHQLFLSGIPSQLCVNEIITLANSRGGLDNITAICVKFNSE